MIEEDLLKLELRIIDLEEHVAAIGRDYDVPKSSYEKYSKLRAEVFKKLEEIYINEYKN